MMAQRRLSSGPLLPSAVCIHSLITPILFGLFTLPIRPLKYSTREISLVLSRKSTSKAAHKYPKENAPLFAKIPRLLQKASPSLLHSMIRLYGPRAEVRACAAGLHHPVGPSARLHLSSCSAPQHHASVHHAAQIYTHDLLHSSCHPLRLHNDSLAIQVPWASRFRLYPWNPISRCPPTTGRGKVR
jgi:hypothetical protein